jgi:hypothetical protein
MQLQEIGELADGHDIALPRLFYLLVRCQNQGFLLGDFAVRILEETQSPAHGMTKLTPTKLRLSISNNQLIILSVFTSSRSAGWLRPSINCQMPRNRYGYAEQ